MPRERLPDRRAGINLEFDHIAPSGVAYRYHASLGFFPDGRIGEIFLSCGRTGTDVDISTRDAAIAMSLALQAGCEFEVLAAAFLRRDDNTPDGPLGTLCHLIDGLKDLVMIQPEQAAAQVERAVPVAPVADVVVYAGDGHIVPISVLANRAREAVIRGYVAEACPDCKNYTLVRNGTCLKCDTCGATTGCS